MSDALNHRRIEGDCLEVMRDLPRGHYDLLLTDPPYAMPATFVSGWAQSKRRWSDTSIMTTWWRCVMEHVLPLLTPQAMLAVFASAHSCAALWPIIHESTQTMQLAVWDKDHPAMGSPFSLSTEFIIVGALGIAYRRQKGFSNVLRFKKVHPSRRQHPAQKPRDLLIALAGHLCPDGGRVLDPFAGSFSTEAACDSLGLECTSIEWGEAFAMPDEQVDLFSP